MATGVLISSFSYVGAPVLSAVFGFFKTSSSVQIQRLQIVAQTAPVAGPISIQLVDETGAAFAGASVTLPAGSAYYDQPLAAPITLGLSRILRAQITSVDSGVASDIVLNLMGATAQNTTAPSGNCGAQECFPPQAQLMFFQGSVAQEQQAAAASAAAAAASATQAGNSATNSQNSATNSQNSATNAATSAAAAANSATQAAAYATNANNASAGAAVYAGQAAASATAAAASAVQAAAFAAGIRGARLQLAVGSVQNIADATPTPVAWDSFLFDDDTFWDPANPTRLTIPANVTRVRISGGIRWAANVTGERKLKIRSNPAGIYDADSIWGSDDRPSDASGDATVESGPIDVEAGMYFELLVEQNSGAPLALDAAAAADNHGNFFSIEVLKRS